MLQEGDYGQTELAMQGASGRYLGDSTLLVKFFLNPKLNQGKSAEAGRPIYEDVPYVQIMQPGNKDSIVIRPATQMDKSRFAEHWKKYLAREDQEAIEGTPIEEWAGVTRSMVEELKYMNIRTVEQLATLSDTHASKIMGIQNLKAKAAKYLESAKDTATAEALAAANARIDELMARLDANNEASEEGFEEVDED